MIRVLIADDHALLTDSLKMVLESFDGFQVVGIAHDGWQACEMCKEIRPDVVLMDIRMPILDGINAIAKIKDVDPGIKVIILTSLEEKNHIFKAFMNGADAYLMKDTPPDRLKVLIQCVLWGYQVLGGELKELLDSACRDRIQDRKRDQVLAALKEEDVEIIKCISEGKNNNEIAEIFGYANGTVKNKVTRLLEITGTGNRAQLVMFALKHNII
ncbi:MAG TPA: response regulator transcription factor [Thermoclostridium caenicola]|uniref:Stage 0 sporulation protein A homolog n=1 Tax=Thermoclostridium caenicola TaxID=659425 RepID=A0A1M6CZU8_9FIRM|nr:response regulator transcription factor [Thermoclostridium caenicola]SHI66542.1 two component transcriptional regulator, LuxR family [Thermoclostridium caenicola]HOK44022.1 response regulator transcription factor [Thermoclostridium caenicola]HOL84048.1 response regulator transcription factor [Thermoclostridium caenicola]HOP71944.1 response regulator transcription factor [Thermoclostridium caenicola]HPO76937.1 response regulator transcription factor [Thermoclostridium caenicola]